MADNFCFKVDVWVCHFVDYEIFNGYKVIHEIIKENEHILTRSTENDNAVAFNCFSPVQHHKIFMVNVCSNVWGKSIVL